jgi:hypothetical protein
MDPGPIGRGGVWGPWHLPEQGRGSVLVLKAGEPCASGTDICALKSWLSPAMASRSPQTLATGDMGCPQSPRARFAVDCVILASFVPKGCGWHCAYRPHGDPVSLGVTRCHTRQPRCATGRRRRVIWDQTLHGRKSISQPTATFPPVPFGLDDKSQWSPGGPALSCGPGDTALTTWNHRLGRRDTADVPTDGDTGTRPPCPHVDLSSGHLSVL